MAPRAGSATTTRRWRPKAPRSISPRRNRTGALSPTEAECDGLDNQLQRRLRRGFLVGGSNQPLVQQQRPRGQGLLDGQGTCTLTGAFACSANTLSQVCADAGGVALPASGDTTKATDELCNGKDDDCNGLVDESTSFTIGAKTLQGWHDPVVQFNVPADPGFQGLPAHTIFMYQYEASRPDANAFVAGWTVDASVLEYGAPSLGRP